MVLSLENIPMVTTIVRAISQGALRHPGAAAAFRWHSTPASTADAESRLERPMMLVTHSVDAG